MRPERLKNRTQQFANDRQCENDRAAEDRDRDFERGVKLQRTRSKFRRSSDRGAEREAGHKTRKDQRRRPNRIPKCEAAQSQPERLKNERADSGNKKNNRKNRQSHRAIITR